MVEKRTCLPRLAKTNNRSEGLRFALSRDQCEPPTRFSAPPPAAGGSAPDTAGLLREETKKRTTARMFVMLMGRLIGP